MDRHAAGPAAWSGLMAATQAGDREAYRRLLTEIVPFVRALARGALRDATEAEDTVQDVLLTLHTMRHVYDPGRPFQPWLAGIARHRIADRARRRARLRAREQSIAPADETSIAAAPNDTADSWDTSAMLRAVARLPAGQRRAIELTKLREMSLREASAASGMTVAALKVATHRGLARLRILLADGSG